MSTAAWTFEPLLPLVPVVAGAAAALGGRLQRAAVEDRGRRLGLPPGGEAEDGPQVVDDGLEAAGGQPAAGLLVDRRPGREVGREVTPGGAGADEPAQGVEDVAEVMLTLAGVLGQQAEVGQDELPFGVGDVAGVGLVCDHTLNYAHTWTTVHNTEVPGVEDHQHVVDQVVDVEQDLVGRVVGAVGVVALEP